MPREIKTRIVLEGEQQYRNAMKEAASANKTLNSEMKLAKAQFEATGDAQQYAADQARILKEQIENQKKAVKAAEDALAELTKNGVDKNSEQMQKWRTKLNNAKTSLTQMQTKLDKVGTELGEEQTEFGKTGQSAEEFGNKMDSVSKAITMQAAIEAIDRVTEHIEAIIRTAAKAAKAFWDMGVDAGNWADDLVTAANTAGVDPETYQSWQYASRIIDTSVDDIVKNWRDIDNKMLQTGDSFYEYAGGLAKLGVATQTASGQMRQGKDIFWDIIDRLHAMGDESAYASKAAELFGNDWRKLNPLIQAGSKAYKDLAEESRSFAVVSNENVEALAGVDDKTEQLEASLTKQKYDALAALAPTFSTVADALQKAIEAMNEFVQSEEGQAALAELNTTLTGLIDSFLGEDGGKGSFESIVTKAKTAVTGFTDAMDWISKNGSTVTTLIEGLGVAWAGLKVAKGVLTFMQLLQAMPLDKLKTVFSGKSASAEGAGAGGDFMKKAAENASKAANDSSASAARSAESAAKSAESAAKSSESVAKSAESAAKSSESTAKSAESAAKSSEAAAKSAEAASSSSAAAAESSAAALDNSIAAADSAAAAVEQAAGAGAARAALEAGASGALESSAAAAAARIEAEAAAKSAMEAAARAAITGGSSTGVSFPRITPRISVGLPAGNGQPALPAGSNPLALPAGSAAGGGGLSAAAKAVTAALPTLAKILGGFGIGAAVALTPASTASDDLDALYDEMGNLTTAAKEAGVSLDEFGQEVVADINEIKRQQKYGGFDENRSLLEETWDRIRETKGDWSEATQALNDFELNWSGTDAQMDKALDAIVDLLNNSGWEEMENLPEEWFSIGTEAGNNLADGITESSETAIAAAADAAKAAGAEADALAKDMTIYGENAAVGLANGIDRRAGSAIGAARAMAGAVSSIVRTTLMIRSPSKVMEGLGEFTGLGFAEGIENSASAVDRAVGRMLGATTRRPVMAMGGVLLDGAPARGAGSAAGSSAGGEPDTVHVTLVLDDEILGDVMAPIVNQKIGAQIQATSRA